MKRWWLQLLPGRCLHLNVIRERRPITVGDTVIVADVPHHVCLACKHAEPIITRTPEEHREAQRAGAIVPLRAVPQPPDPQTGVGLLRLRERKRA